LTLLPVLWAAAGCSSLTAERLDLDFSPAGHPLPERPVIVFFVDGLQPDVFAEMAAAGELPRLRRFLLDRAASVNNAVTGVPSITFTNATTMITGVHPGRHGILGNRWFDRDTLIHRRYDNLAGMSRANGDFRRPTIYERLSDLHTAVVTMQVNRGVKAPVDVWGLDGGLQAGITFGLGWALLTDQLVAKRFYEVGRYSRPVGRWPDFLLVYLPGTDHVGHDFGHKSPEYRAALRNLDDTLGKVLEVLDGHGVLDRFTIALTSDHGHAESASEGNRLLLETFFAERLGMPVDHVEKNEGTPYRDRYRHYKDVRAVLVREGDRRAHLHLRTGAEWTQRPTPAEVLAFHRVHGRPDTPARAAGDLPDVLLAEPAVGYVVAPLDADTVRIYGKAGVSESRRTRDDGAGARFVYRVVCGRDPLGYADDPTASRLLDGRPHGVREWLEATAGSAHPDSAVQLVEMFGHRRAGDLAIFAAPGWDFSETNLGGHGGLERSEMRIPMYFAGPGIVPGRTLHAARLVDLVPTVLDLMGRPVPTDVDGISLAPRLTAPVTAERETVGRR
jgi:arylsulfatase A-like enzyme